MDAIDRFGGEYDWLSNFYPSPVEYEGAIYPSVEHAFQAAKSHDPAEREKVRSAKPPGSAKYLGKRVALRPDWEAVKRDIMRGLVRRKFADPDLRARLLGTGDRELVEGNTWHDPAWGRCTCARCGGKGENALGTILMHVRDELREG